MCMYCINICVYYNTYMYMSIYIYIYIYPRPPRSYPDNGLHGF